MEQQLSLQPEHKPFNLSINVLNGQTQAISYWSADVHVSTNLKTCSWCMSANKRSSKQSPKNCMNMHGIVTTSTQGLNLTQWPQQALGPSSNPIMLYKALWSASFPQAAALINFGASSSGSYLHTIPSAEMEVWQTCLTLDYHK